MNKICYVDGCGILVGKHGAKGMCPYHYKRYKSGIPFNKPKQGTFVRKCSCDGCNKKHYGGGYCKTHYWRNKSIGGLNNSNRIPRLFLNDTTNNCLFVPLGVNAKDGYAIIDENYKYLEKYQWTLGTRGYAITNIDRKSKYLHHFVLGPTDNLVINHKNENKLDNRADNLELVDRRSNNTFKSISKKSNTGVRGVYLDNRSLNKPYIAQISWGSIRRKKYLPTLDEAIYTRKEWEMELFGRIVS